MDNHRLRDFVDFAIDQEIRAVKFYAALAKKSINRDQKAMLEDLAQVEAGHEKKLKDFRDGGRVTFAQLEKAIDLNISDFLVEETIRPDSPIQDVLIFAMKKEEKAFELYNVLAGLESDPEVRDFFESLAAEEKGHKYEFEKQYDAMVLKEN